jgi:hypothetical protein
MTRGWASFAMRANTGVRTLQKQTTYAGEYVYKPFGERVTLSGEEDMQGFIGKQKDREMGLADYGLRKVKYCKH